MDVCLGEGGKGGIGGSVIFTAPEVWRGGEARSSSAEFDVMLPEMDSLIFILHPKGKVTTEQQASFMSQYIKRHSLLTLQAY